MTHLLDERITNFIGRQDYFDQIINQFKTNQILVLCAFGGTGKSAFANEFGHRIKDKESELLSFLVNSETPEKISSTFRQIACMLKLDLSNVEIQKNLITFIKNELSILNKSFLFIFDNVDKYEYIRSFIHILSLLQFSQVKFLLTTRNKDLIDKSDKSDIIEFDCFNNQEANEYIRKYVKLSNISDLDLNILIDFVKVEAKILPLKLKLTVNFINKNLRYKLEDIFKLIKEKSSKSKQVEEYLFRDLSSESKTVMAHLCFLDPDFIALDFYNKLFEQKYEETQEDPLINLNSSGLIDVDFDKRSIKMHRIVQDDFLNFYFNDFAKKKN